MKFEKFSKQHIQIVLLTFSFVSLSFIISGLWAIDIGVSGMMINAVYPDIGIIATNGWWTRNPIQQYHIGLYLVFIGMIIFVNVSVIAITYFGKKELDGKSLN